MQLTFLLCASLAQLAVAGVLNDRSDCSPNNCARAVTGTDGRVPLTLRRADCSSFMTATVTYPIRTVTVAVTTTVPFQPAVAPRQVTVIPNAVPTYASACSGTVKYSSACSCWGITAGTVTSAPITVTATVTSTVTATPAVATARGIIQVTNLADNQILGFISKNTFSNSLLRYEAPEANALIVTFVAAPGSTSVDTEVTITQSDLAAPNTFLGLIQGRDDASSSLQPGSFHYLYFSGTSHSSPNTPPSFVGNSYSTVTSLERTSESSVWTINLATGAFTGKWTNPVGTPATTITFWTQSGAIYAGADVDAFRARYPSTVLDLQLTFLSRP